MQSTIRLVHLWALALFLAGPALAAETPDALVKSTVEEVLAVMKQNRDRAELRRLAEQKILPHFDFQQMTQLAVGGAWRKASPEQQKRLEQGFRTLLVNTYVNALASTGKAERTVDVKPAPASAQGKDATVRTVVKEGSRPPIPIDYRMSRESGSWKVFDVLVEGVSLVSTYRSTFAEAVNAKGVDGLIQMLEERNRTIARG